MSRRTAAVLAALLVITLVPLAGSAQDNPTADAVADLCACHAVDPTRLRLPAGTRAQGSGG